MSQDGTIPPTVTLRSTLGTVRWTAARKRSVVIDVRTGRISVAEARERYLLSPEELDAWDEAFEREGVSGLQLKRQFRPSRKKRFQRQVAIAPVIYEAADD